MTKRALHAADMSSADIALIHPVSVAALHAALWRNRGRDKVVVLKARGGTAALNRDHLGEPDKAAANPHYRSVAPARLYRLEHVTEAEQSETFVTGRVKAQHRQEAAAKAVAAKRAALMADIAAMSIEVSQQPGMRRDAIHAYNERREDWRDCSEFDHVDRHSDPAFLARTAVNYIRHHLTEYDESLEVAAVRVGASDAVTAILRKVYAAIAEAYPGLARECERQLARARAIGRLTPAFHTQQ